MSIIQSTLPRESTDAAPWPLLAITATTVLLALPALWNGYPLVYYDSVDYVLMPFTWDMPIYRTGAYGVFALLGRMTHSLWGIVFAQSLMVAYVLYEGFKLWIPAAPKRGLVVFTAILCMVTGLPWATSQIMPDAFTGAVILAILILAFHDGMLNRRRQIALTAILATGIAVHTSHIAVAGGLVACLLAMKWMAARGWPVLQPRLRAICLALVASLGIAIGSNWAMTGRPFLAQPSAVLTLGLLVQDGLAKRYLDEVCRQSGPDKPALCMARNRLPLTANDFLWHDDDFWKLGGWTGMETEAHRIVQGCLYKYPVTYALTSLRLMAQQLLMVDTGDGVAPMQFFIGHAIQKYYPQEMPAFTNAEQQQGVQFASLNHLQVPILLLSCGALVPLLWLACRRRDKLSVALAGLVLLALLGNAFVCGALSNPNDRYQSRIAWVATLVVGIAGVRLFSSKDEESGRRRGETIP